MKFLEIKLNEENKKNYIKIVIQNINNQTTPYQITSIPLVGKLVTKHNKNQQIKIMKQGTNIIKLKGIRKR